MTVKYREKPTLHEFFNILFRELQCVIWQNRMSKTPIAKFTFPTGKFLEFETLVDNLIRKHRLFIFRNQPRPKLTITPNQNWTTIGVTATWKTDPKVFNAMDRIGQNKNRIWNSEWKEWVKLSEKFGHKCHSPLRSKNVTMSADYLVPKVRIELHLKTIAYSQYFYLYTVTY